MIQPAFRCVLKELNECEGRHPTMMPAADVGFNDIRWRSSSRRNEGCRDRLLLVKCRMCLFSHHGCSSNEVALQSPCQKYRMSTGSRIRAHGAPPHRQRASNSNLARGRKSNLLSVAQPRCCRKLQRLCMGPSGNGTHSSATFACLRGNTGNVQLVQCKTPESGSHLGWSPNEH
jgi:hypothetical protein